MSDFSDTTIPDAVRRATELTNSANHNGAIRTLIDALGQVFADEKSYNEGVLALRRTFAKKGDARSALSCSFFLQDDLSNSTLLRLVPAFDRARAYFSSANRLAPNSPEASQFFSQAAANFEEAGWIAHAANCAESARDFERARVLWSRLSQTLGSKEADLYAAALAHFNLARISRVLKDERTALDAIVSSVRLLEEAADRYEAIGQRERAFDCFQVLVAIGKETASVEHALEGYVNIIRILREDQLRTYALQTFDEAIDFVTSKQEISAAATLAREMAVYAQKEGLPQIANFASLRQAQMWRELASITMNRGGPPEIAENALLAAVVAYADLGQFSKAGGAYVELAHLPIEQSRRSHYAHAASRYTNVVDERLDAEPIPQAWKRDNSISNVWVIDILEWEQRGAASEACADILLSTEAWSDIIRRRALIARLSALYFESVPGQNTEGALALLSSLEALELYSILSPIEALYESRSPEVRAAAAGTLARFLYKRSFLTLRRAISDPSPTVQKAACASVRALHFPHAFDPLARILRETQNPEAKIAALQSLAQVDSSEAAELVLGVFCHAGPQERQDVEKALCESSGERFLRLALEASKTSSGAVQEALRRVFKARGVRF